ncbi:MAG: CDP-alcohol phosphatidyltransferase family protein [Nitrospirota bacterium]
MIAGNLPNILTIARIVLLPFFAVSLIYGNYDYALILFLLASVTDVLDGYVARIKKQATDFGSILDPVADKFLLITAFIIISVQNNEWIPKWLTIIVISRDLIVVTGWLIIYFVTHNPKVEPSILGKATNALQFLLIGITLLFIKIKGETCGVNGDPCIPMFFLATVAVLTAISGLHYIYKGLETTNIERAEK